MVLSEVAGNFSELQQAEPTRYIQLNEIPVDPARYFACKVVGESMNKIIPNGVICLFEIYQGGSCNGLICLVESNDFIDREFGSNYTIKEYSSKKSIIEEGWEHQEITLLPKSPDATFQPIVLRDEELLDFKVISMFTKMLK